MLSLRLDLFGRTWLLLDLWPKPEEPAAQVVVGGPVLELAEQDQGDAFGFITRS